MTRLPLSDLQTKSQNIQTYPEAKTGEQALIYLPATFQLARGLRVEGVRNLPETSFTFLRKK